MGGPLKRTMNKALQHAIQKGQIISEDESEKGGSCTRLFDQQVHHPFSCVKEALVILRKFRQASFN